MIKFNGKKVTAEFGQGTIRTRGFMLRDKACLIHTLIDTKRPCGRVYGLPTPTVKDINEAQIVITFESLESIDLHIEMLQHLKERYMRYLNENN